MHDPETPTMSTVSTTQPFTHVSTRTLLIAAALVLVALAMFGFWLWSGSAERKAITGLQPEERRALYDRTLRNLQEVCDLPERPSGLDDYCRRQADFIAKFPECDAACAALANKQKNQPSR